MFLDSLLGDRTLPRGALGDLSGHHDWFEFEKFGSYDPDHEGLSAGPSPASPSRYSSKELFEMRRTPRIAPRFRRTADRTGGRPPFLGQGRTSSFRLDRESPVSLSRAPTLGSRSQRDSSGGFSLVEGMFVVWLSEVYAKGHSVWL
jgi:hypothetical protein